MGTATRVTQWTTTSTTGVVGETKTQKPLPVQLSQYGPGQPTLWKLSPPLEGNEYIVICDRGMLMQVTSIQGEQAVPVPTKVPALVEVFAARPDGAMLSMTTLRKPISLNRPLDGINVKEILRGLGYEVA